MFSRICTYSGLGFFTSGLMQIAMAQPEDLFVPKCILALGVVLLVVGVLGMRSNGT